MATSTDIAVVGWAQTPMVRHTELSETQLLVRVITDALEPLGLTRSDVDFTCLGSCDYITGQAFSFVGNLDPNCGSIAKSSDPVLYPDPSCCQVGLVVIVIT